jgi:hypothetical protein
MTPKFFKKITFFIWFAGLFNLSFARVDSSLQKGMFFQIDKGAGSPFSFNLTGSEIIFQSTLSSSKRDIMKFDVQLFLWGSMDGWSKGMHYGNIYAIFPFGPGRFNLKIGQHVVPFGMQAEYDSHGQLFQQPYALNIGERIDIGISLFGILGPIDYFYMISNGNEPNHPDRDDDKVHTLRLAVLTRPPVGDFKFGISVLRGVLPNFTNDPFIDMSAVPDTFIMKTRLGFDWDIQLPIFTLRGEVSAGPNGGDNPFSNFPDRSVFAGYAEARIPISYDLELMGMYSRFQLSLSGGEATYEFGPGLNYTLPDISAITLQFALLRRFYQGLNRDRAALLLVVKL